MSNLNNIPGYFDRSVQNLREAVGVTQFLQADVNSYLHIVGGIIIQGGYKIAGGAGAVPFQASFPKQVLGVFMNGATASAVTLNGFTASDSGFWFAIGV
jgi:hypothetical protein